ncbi:unnamed protein product [Miscanthus lutarioriparius]|uniref:TFIIS N-terminal domain-containing protein n=1 Tax=Miscanthus lutarioriparius TaxID=422564 RepID=A0A811Q7L9_9POAL|nr:unnamed protein product [Miscanthus lutarioriparius]
MANEHSGSPLRRWRPFYGAFGAIDGAIEAGGHPRSAFREVRSRIVVLLRSAADDGVAEQLCAALDDTMVEALETLRVAPVPHSALASTDLARAVVALGNHGSARIRSLANDVVHQWSAAIDDDVATATAVKERPDKLFVSGDRIPRQGISTVSLMATRVNLLLHKLPPAKMLPAAAVEVHKKKLHISPPKMLPTAAAAVEVHTKKLYIPPAKKMLPTATAIVTEEHKKKLYVPPAKMIPTTATVLGRQNTSEAKKPIVAQSKKMETTKRKLREGYQEAERIKRQHTIQKINDKDAAKMFEQKQRKMHPIVQGRGPTTCRTSLGVSRSLLPSLQMI